MSANYSPANVIKVAALLISKGDPNNEELFDGKEATSLDIYQELEKYLPNLNKVHSIERVIKWLTKSDLLPQQKRRRVNSNAKRLYTL